MKKYEVKFQNETGDIQGTNASYSLLKAIKATLKDENAAYIVDIVETEGSRRSSLRADCPETKIKAELKWGDLKNSLCDVLCCLNMYCDSSLRAQFLLQAALFELCCPECTKYNKV